LITLFPGLTVAQGDAFSINSFYNKHFCINSAVPNYYYPFPNRTCSPRQLSPTGLVSCLNSPAIHYSNKPLRAPVSRPPLKFSNITKQALAGGLGAWLGAVIATPFYNDKEFTASWIPPQLVTGICLGAGAGVYCGGISGNESSSFYNTMLGSLGGITLGMLLTRADHEPFYLLVIPPVTATVTFNLSRKYKNVTIDAREGYYYID